MNREEYNFKDYYPFFEYILFGDWDTTRLGLQCKEELNNRIYDVLYPLAMFPHF